jgi:hypothetical protein
MAKKKKHEHKFVAPLGASVPRCECGAKLGAPQASVASNVAAAPPADPEPAPDEVTE